MKRFVAISIVISIVAAAVALSATSTFAQCWGGRCYSRGYTRSVYQYAPSYGYWTSGQCVQRTRGSVAMEGAAPCADVPNRYAEVVDACVPVESVPACGAVETTPTCGEYAPIKTDEGLVYRSCPTGACPLKTARTAVASLLDALNATRARYGLHALSYDATLTGGSQYQASYCASRGALIHGSGAEVLAYNNEGVETALRQWLNSPAHRALLLSPNFTRGGIAVHRTSTGRVYVAARFR